MRYRKYAIFTFLCAVLLLPFFAWGHALYFGGFDVQVNGKILDIKVTTPEERTINDEALFSGYLQNTIYIAVNGEDAACPFEMKSFETGVDAESIPTTMILQAQCPEEMQSIYVEVVYLSEEGYGYAVSVTKDGFTQSAIVDDTNSVATFDFTDAPQTTVGKAESLFGAIKQFIWLGMKHIYTGYDHILFVLALMIGVLNIRKLLKIITAFTLAHSITLILSGLSIISVRPGIVEPLIALSIVYVAFEDIIFEVRKKLFNKDSVRAIASHRWKVAFGFGLFHGLGFASVLKEVQIPGGAFIPSLISFNVGVEIGQITIIAAVLPILYLVSKSRFQKHVLTFLSIVIGCLGLFWFIQRVFF